jgi:NTE family protein
MFTALALGGGGYRGFMIVGALKELSKQQPLEFPDGIYGLSIGAILATAVAYRIPIDKIQSLFQSVSVDQIVPDVRLDNLMNASSAKGVYSTEPLGNAICDAFMKVGIDLSHAVLADAPQPLRIIASNITRCNTTVFEGNVPILDALRASCALPGIFHPHTIYDSAYVDGCLYISAMYDALPISIRETALIINLGRRNRGIPPSMVSQLSPFKYTEMLYQGCSQLRLKQTRTPNTVILYNEKVDSMDALTTDQQQELIDSGEEQLALWTQRPYKP